MNIWLTDRLSRYLGERCFAVGIIGCFKGYYSSKGTEGVGRSANSAVVLASVMVFVIDLIAVQITDILNLN